MSDRFAIRPGQPTMKAVVTTGNGGYDKLEFRDVPRPRAGPGEVVLRVLAAGVNNTEINTRLGWYSGNVTTATSEAADNEQVRAAVQGDGGWNEATPFPFIQGTDCCGVVAEAFDAVHEHLLGKRCIVRACMRPNGFASPENIWMASDFDGAFAEFVKVPASEVFPIECSWSDAELATLPCAYGTAENMLERVRLVAGEHVLISGASGGVGSAAVQLARRRGAHVTAITGQAKAAHVRELGADRVVLRGDDVVDRLGENAVDVVVDNVAGPGFGAMLKVLKRGGRYTSSGAIAGPLVELDMRDFYLKDITMVGCTGWDEPVFPNLVSYVERGELKPLLAKVFALADIADAQAEFLTKQHVGNFVLLPPENQTSA
ncbi:MAG: zinc-binding dehydrogenase [Pseudomonadota bacterium]